MVKSHLIFNKTLSSILLLFLSIQTSLVAQEITPIVKNKSEHSDNKFIETLENAPWTIGVSGTVVDDDGKPFNNLFNVGKTWNFLPYPSKVFANCYLDNGLSLQSEFAFDKYKLGRNINGETINTSWNFFSADINLCYELNQLIKNMKWFDPYLVIGYGYTRRSGAVKQNSFNYNTGIGFNIWIVNYLALNLQSVGKFSMIEGTSNYLHHSVGLIYTLNWGVNAKNTLAGTQNVGRTRLKAKY